MYIYASLEDVVVLLELLMRGVGWRKV